MKWMNYVNRGLRNGLAMLLAALVWNQAAMASAPRAERDADAMRAATPVAQRLSYIESLLRSKTGQRLNASDDAIVKKQLSDIREYLAKAKAALQAGDTARAEQWSGEIMAALMAASRRLPDDADDLQAEQLRYKNLRQGIDVFQQARQRNAGRLSTEENKSAPGFDAKAVADWVREGDHAAAGGDYRTANAFLLNAQEALTGAIRGMLNHRTLVHELKLDSPAAEYQYELQRYQGYADLIPVAIDMRAPPAQTITQMLASMDKAQWMARQAGRTADKGDYPVAIRMLLDATDVVRGALRDAGVEM